MINHSFARIKILQCNDNFSPFVEGMNSTERTISSGSDYEFSGLGLRELSNDVTMRLTMMSNVNKGQGGFPLINFTKNRKPMCRGVHSLIYTFIFYLFQFDPKLFRAGS